MGIVGKATAVITVSWALAAPGWATIPAQQPGSPDFRAVLSRATDPAPRDDTPDTFTPVMRSMVHGLLGEALSRAMDDSDLMMTILSLENGGTELPSRWRNPRTGTLYSMKAKRTYDEAGGPCLDYSMEAVRGSRREQVNGTACRRADGSWGR